MGRRHMRLQRIELRSQLDNLLRHVFKMPRVNHIQHLAVRIFQTQMGQTGADGTVFLAIKQSVLPVPRLDSRVVPKLEPKDIEGNITLRLKQVAPKAVQPIVDMPVARLPAERRTKQNRIRQRGQERHK